MKGLTKAERYIHRTTQGSGSRKFSKEWLLGKPLDKFVIKKFNRHEREDGG